MTDQSPTTVNGPLHTPEATLQDRVMRATYATPGDAHAARDLLLQNGIESDQVSIIDNAAESPEIQASLQPTDPGIIARVRDMLVPDDSNTATQNATRHKEAILELRPTREQVETAVSILQSSNPSHFDASLERWRNAG